MTERSDLPRDDTRRLAQAIRGQVAQRRFAALAAAVRSHEARTARQITGGRPHDAALYRQLRQILGDGAATPAAERSG
jgi:hypothetical protein